MNTNDARRLTQDAQEALRKRAVQAYRNGMTQKQVCETFGVSRSALNNWMAAFREGGMPALKKKTRGRKKGGIRLEPIQAAQTVKMIQDRCPDQLKMPFVLWTREAVRDLIRRRFNVDVSVWTVGRYLKRWGFSPQKPLRKAFEQDPRAVRKWLDEEYPAIQSRAKAQKAEIHWGDEMGLRSDHQAGRSYGRKGKTPVITGTGQRFSCNMISTVTNRGTLRFMVFDQRFTAPVFVKFLQRLVRSASRKIFLILDRHPVHKSSKVNKWLSSHEEQIEVHFLPAYSPELNPDEMLNNDVKNNAVGRRRPSSRKEMLSDVRGYLLSTQKQPHIVRSYFRESSVQYAASGVDT